MSSLLCVSVVVFIVAVAAKFCESFQRFLPFYNVVSSPASSFVLIIRDLIHYPSLLEPEEPKQDHPHHLDDSIKGTPSLHLTATLDITYW